MRIHFGGTVLHLHLPSIMQSSTARSFALILVIVFVTLFLFIGQPSDSDTSSKSKMRRSDDNDLKFRPLDAMERSKYASAMEVGLTRRRLLLQIQREILTKQVRPPDSQYNINITLSDNISMDRPLPDTRPEICKSFHYDVTSLGTVTVVIPFYNEALSMLIRTVHSILNRTPDVLLDQIILVDDKSTREYLMEPLDRYVQLLPKVKIVRRTERSGLIVSRMQGYRMATSPVVIFLDAHTECNEGWLEPLLDDLRRHPDSVIQPFVDGVDRLTLDFAAPPSYYVGSFSWDLR